MKHKYKPDRNTIRIQSWLRQNPRTTALKLVDFLKDTAEKCSITHVLHSHATKTLRRDVVTAFKLK